MTLGKVLKAIVVMRSLFIDRTIVRGFSENVYSEDGKVLCSGLKGRLVPKQLVWVVLHEMVRCDPLSIEKNMHTVLLYIRYYFT